ncbi:Serine palmitoyltransferase 1 [Yarrowia sp. B02]|nr:Serine palmitoyltransferase 1 [Yarrowia sp. B02]
METVVTTATIAAAAVSPSPTPFTTQHLAGEQILSKLHAIASSAAYWGEKLPGSAVVKRYIVSSHQNDPVRTIFELLFFLFAVRYFVASRYSTSNPHHVKFSEADIDELVAEWEPEPLVPKITALEELDIGSIPLIHGESGPVVDVESPRVGHVKRATNLASTDFLGWARDPVIKERAVQIVREYGVGSCGPPGFYGNQDIHVKCEKDLARFCNAESAILYAQAFNTMSSVIPSFMKRGDIVIADDRVGTSTQKGLQVSRVTLRWYKHNDMADLERVLAKTNHEFRKAPLTKRFIVTEGLFENTGDLCSLPEIVELKYKYKYRLLLDESLSFGLVGSTGRGVLEHYQENGHPELSRQQIELTAGNMAITFSSAGGFVAGSDAAVEHQRIGSNAVTFSASMPGYLAAASSQAILRLEEDPSRVTTLQKHTAHFRGVLEKQLKAAHVLGSVVEFVSAPQSPHILIKLSDEFRPETLTSFVAAEELLQQIVDLCLAEGVLITRHKRVPTHEIIALESMLRIEVCAALSIAQLDEAASVIAGVVKSIASA